MAMGGRSNTLTFLILFLGFQMAGFTAANANDDMEDGISDDDIAYSDSIKTDIPINFIKRDARGDAAMQSKRAMDALEEESVGLQGSAYIKEGAVVDGDITIIYEGDDNSVIVD